MQGSQQGATHLDSTPQDVLAEARKNLQALIDSGISRDLLHQWVDGGSSEQSSYAAQPSSFTQSNAQQQYTGFPPAPQNAPPPPPTRTMSDPAIIPLSSTTTTSPASTGLSSSTPPSLCGADVKSESMIDNGCSATQPWAAVPVPMSDNLMSVKENEQINAQNIFNHPQFQLSAQLSSQLSAHRPRISVCSTSSASSGHASLWSVGSAQSSMSWQSASSARTHAPLPSVPSSSASTVGSSTTVNKTNVYWCTSCDTSFKRKYDWKRHEDEFHERWRKYPCPEPGCNRSFWGSNSFNQHHKGCHNCLTCPHAEQVVKFLKKRKFWACGFCSALHPARERHVEHVARHFESGLSKTDWMHSRVIYGLLHQPKIHTAWEALVTNKANELGGRRPQFSWHPSKTGRAQGFLEKENAGQLQDLLEFFSGDDEEAEWVAKVAFDNADMVVNKSASPSPPFQQSSVATAFTQPETHIAFSQLPSHQAPHPPAVLGSTVAQQLRGSLYQTSQFSTASRASPDSTRSSVGLSTPPMLASQAHQEVRELPAVPSSSADSIMDFEYSPAPVMFSNDWGNMSTEHLLGNPQQQLQTGDWGSLQYLIDQPAASS